MKKKNIRQTIGNLPIPYAIFSKFLKSCQPIIFRHAWFTTCISCVYKLSSCNLGVRTDVDSVRMICQKLYVCLFITLH